MPIFKAKHLGEELFGLEKLRTFAASLYGDSIPEEVLYKGSPYVLEETGDGYLLKIHLPFMKSKSFRVNKYGDEIAIQIGNRRHNHFLPRFVNFYRLTTYEYQAPWLILTLEK
ncbi:MAG: hypothetical protein U5K79_00575 [Cyclobacteriaceae bacterium]|nr:hypothetical protein [Cyclobacteriaceae bacterium]